MNNFKKGDIVICVEDGIGTSDCSYDNPKFQDLKELGLQKGKKFRILDKKIKNDNYVTVESFDGECRNCWWDIRFKKANVDYKYGDLLDKLELEEENAK